MEIKDIIKEFERLEKEERDHYWRWQFLGCFLKENNKKLEKIKINKKLARNSNRKIINSIYSLKN